MKTICKAVKLPSTNKYQFLKISQGKACALGYRDESFDSAEEACDAYRDFLKNNNMEKHLNWIDFYEKTGENTTVMLNSEE